MHSVETSRITYSPRAASIFEQACPIRSPSAMPSAFQLMPRSPLPYQLVLSQSWAFRTVSDRSLCRPISLDRPDPSRRICSGWAIPVLKRISTSHSIELQSEVACASGQRARRTKDVRTPTSGKMSLIGIAYRIPPAIDSMSIPSMTLHSARASEVSICGLSVLAWCRKS